MQSMGEAQGSRCGKKVSRLAEELWRRRGRLALSTVIRCRYARIVTRARTEDGSGHCGKERMGSKYSKAQRIKTREWAGVVLLQASVSSIPCPISKALGEWLLMRLPCSLWRAKCPLLQAPRLRQSPNSPLAQHTHASALALMQRR